MSRKKQTVRSSYPVPFVAQGRGFFYRLKQARNAAAFRLLGHNKDPHALEVFITATTSKWLCYRDEDRQVELRCFECPQRQQRECALWALARSHDYWTTLYRARQLPGGFLEHPAVRKSRHALTLLWLRLMRVYRVSSQDITAENAVQSRRRRAG